VTGPSPAGVAVGARPTIRRRLLVGFGASILPLLVAGVVGSFVLGRAHDALRARTREVVDVKNHLFASEEATRQYVVLAQADLLGQQGATAATLDSVGVVADSLRRWLTIATAFGDAERSRLARVGGLHARVGARFALARAELDIGRPEAAARHVALASPVLDSLFAESRAIGAAEDERAARMLDEAEALVGRQQLLVRALLVVGLVVAVLFGLFTWRAVAAPLARLADAAKRIGDGDLTASIDTRGLDTEYAVVASAFTEASARLSTLIGAIQREAGEVSAAAAALHVTASSSASATGQMSATIAQVAGAAEEQLRTVGASTEVLAHVTQSAGALDATAADARRLESEISGLTATAHDAVLEAIATLASARDVIGTSEANVRRVEEASSLVQGFVATIQRIASQTNLLALNAAIEAARAGAHGRGFAVVADEVRKLAEESGRAAREVRTVVDGIVSETGTAVAAFRDGARRLGDVSATSHAATEALTSIRRAATSIDALTAAVTEAARANRASIVALRGQIATVTEQAQAQAAASQEATAGAQESAASSEEVVTTAGQLAASAGRLGELVSAFTPATVR
jgi:methyl-accepting chemotaxis protein